MTTLRCALVGTGAVSHFHARGVREYPHAELVAVTNRTRSKAEAFAERWDVPRVYDTLEEILEHEKPDVVLISTAPEVHLEQTRASFAAGAHVIVEKPPAPNLDELEEMRRLAAEAGREMAVVFQQRTGTAAAHFRSLIRSGALGRPLLAQCQTLWYRDASYYAVDWRGSWETEGGGTTLGHGIHQMDLLGFLLGDWASVEARLWRIDRETQTEDTSTAFITFANGVVCTAVSSTLAPRETSSVRLDLEKATITVDHLYGHKHENWKITPAPHVRQEETASWELPDYEEMSDHPPLLRDVFDALRAGEPLPPTADEPARSLELVAAIYASADADGAVITPADIAVHPTHRQSFKSKVIDLRPGRH